MPRAFVEAFSTRRRQIERHMAALGETSAKAAQVATFATRQPKDHHIDLAALRERWRRTADTHGFDPRQIGAVTGWTVATAPSREQLRSIAHALRSDEGLTAHASSFTRRDALRAWAERLPDGADVERMEQLADALLDRDGRVVPLDFARRLDARSVIRRGDGTVVPAETSERLYSAPRMLALERHGRDLDDRRVGDGVAVVDDAHHPLASRGPRTPDRHGSCLAPGSVVVDEAGMVGTRQLVRALEHADVAGGQGRARRRPPPAARHRRGRTVPGAAVNLGRDDRPVHLA